MFQLKLFPRFFGSTLLLMAVLMSLGGCKDNPGKWPPVKVADKVSGSLEVTGLTLSPTSNGLEGTGKRSDGETLTIVVTQDAANGMIKWDAKGDRGFLETGSFSLQ